MNGIKAFIGKEVEVEISGKTFFNGILIDLGLDIIVLYDGWKFLYIPILHLHNIKERITVENEQTEQPPDGTPFQPENETLSYRKVLTNAKGQFVEIYVTGNKSIHGYITSVLNDYIVFYSPVYKSLFISMQHLKWLTPYTTKLTPYTLKPEELPVVPSSISLSRSYEEQIKKFKGQLIIFDMGDNPDKIGLLTELSNNIAEVVTASGKKVYWKLLHLKTVHLP
ncbi:DUF2642 domain-containing protein [Bacillus tianshenii]|uniref:DUF2642 domain-containing protein n=1 Tax=Sutcliffiella tianshenii TaxID=1463404 RepID=UPI001CD37A34|nr:DUF2642 domain-containing protein [Bacillus tianshenii]MCA1319420.1 DUF2642 domain-containing protein [Bacillus tianshenii]